MWPDFSGCEASEWSTPASAAYDKKTKATKTMAVQFVGLGIMSCVGTSNTLQTVGTEFMVTTQGLLHLKY